VNLERVIDVLERMRVVNIPLHSEEAVEFLSTDVGLGLVSSEISWLRGDGPLSEFFLDPLVTEILVNPGGVVWVERGAGLFATEVVCAEAWLRLWIRKHLSRVGKSLNPANPFSDCILPDGSRVHFSFPPVSQGGIALTIRKFPALAISLEEMATTGGLGAGLADYFRSLVSSRRNVFFSGGTGTGKTTLMNALIGEVASCERMIALEDVAELKANHPHLVRLECRAANEEERAEIGLQRLLRESLRMRPDRILVGECRGGEALDLLLALSSGHPGSMGTIHANSPREALRRLEVLALLRAPNMNLSSIQQLIAGAVNVVVQLERVEGRRRVAGIVEVKGVEEGNYLLREIGAIATG